MKGIRPGPFCGGHAEAVEDIIIGGWFVVCHRCEIKTFTFARQKTAIARWWNRRE